MHYLIKKNNLIKLPIDKYGVCNNTTITMADFQLIETSIKILREDKLMSLVEVLQSDLFVEKTLLLIDNSCIFRFEQNYFIKNTENNIFAIYLPK